MAKRKRHISNADLYAKEGEQILYGQVLAFSGITTVLSIKIWIIIPKWKKTFVDQ